MKNIEIRFPTPILAIVLWIMGGIALATLAWSCLKDNPEPEPPQTVEERPYPVETTNPSDVIAFADPVQKRLYLDPEYAPQALEQLGAHNLANNVVLMKGKTFAGNTVEYRLQLSYMPAPSIAETANTTIAALSSAPDIIIQGTDSITGIPVRLRRNWDCGNLWKAFVSDCQNLGNGTSANTHYLEAKTCQPKDGALCPEEYGIWAIRYIYSTKGCGGTPTEIKPERQWVCKG